MPPTVGEQTFAPAGNVPVAVEVLDSDDEEVDEVEDDVELVDDSDVVVGLSDVEVGDGCVEVSVGVWLVDGAVGSTEFVAAGVVLLSRLAHR